MRDRPKILKTVRMDGVRIRIRIRISGGVPEILKTLSPDALMVVSTGDVWMCAARIWK